MAPPWGADQGQGWGLQLGFQEATTSPAAAGVPGQVPSTLPCSHREVPPTLGYRAQLAEAEGTREVLGAGSSPHFWLLEQSAAYEREALAVWAPVERPGSQGLFPCFKVRLSCSLSLG